MKSTFQFQNIKVVLSEERNTETVVRMLENLGYTAKNKLQMSHNFIYASEDSFYISTDSELEAIEILFKYNKVNLNQLYNLVSEHCQGFSFRTAMNLYIIGKSMVTKLYEETTWQDIRNFTIAELEAKDREFDFKENIK